MIIVDLQQVMISNLMRQLGPHTNVKVEEDLLRHMILNSLRSYNVKFKNEYGEMIIACDGYRYWRREKFPYYKANRKKDREQSELDWNTIFESLNRVREELKEFFPYRVIHIDVAEADDVIATLCQKYGNSSEKILIVSGDKDFRQLQSYINVKQYDPVNKKYIEENNPERYLKEHIMKGDRGDGVPNFLSPDNSFVLNIRQKPLRSAKVDIWVDQDPAEFCDDEMLRGYMRNKMLVDLSEIPSDVQLQILGSYNEQSNKDRSKLFNYFINKRLKNLMTDISQF